MTTKTVAMWDNRSAPAGARNTLRGLTRSSGTSREGLAMKATSCSIPGCPKKGPFRRGWCESHYSAWRMHGDPLVRVKGLPASECRAPGCDRPSIYRGKKLCRLHYERLRKFDSFELPAKPSDRDQILKRIQFAESGCWEWLGAVNNRGYGRINGRRYSHRVAYEAWVGPIPEGLELDHLCRNTICCNPEHLEAVTSAENLRRQADAVTHCIRGHEFTAANTYWRPDGGGRQCRKCIAIRGGWSSDAV